MRTTAASCANENVDLSVRLTIASRRVVDTVPYRGERDRLTAAGKLGTRSKTYSRVTDVRIKMGLQLNPAAVAAAVFGSGHICPLEHVSKIVTRYMYRHRPTGTGTGTGKPVTGRYRYTVYNVVYTAY